MIGITGVVARKYDEQETSALLSGFGSLLLQRQPQSKPDKRA